jgi:hypothetical protein
MEQTKQIKIPTLEQLQELPTDALWLEIAELSVHGVPLVAQKARETLETQDTPPTPAQVFDLWTEHGKEVALRATSGTW